MILMIQLCEHDQEVSTYQLFTDKWVLFFPVDYEKYIIMQWLVWWKIQKVLKIFFLTFFADAVSLRIHPNKAQFFEYEPVTFYCEGVSYCVVVNESKMRSCNNTNWKTSGGSSCTITNVYADDSGFWLNAGCGTQSNSVNIAVTGEFL